MEWNIRQLEEGRGGSKQEKKIYICLWEWAPWCRKIQGEKGRGTCTCTRAHTHIHTLRFKKKIMTTFRCVCTCTQKCEKLKQESNSSWCWGEIRMHTQRKPSFSWPMIWHCCLFYLIHESLVRSKFGFLIKTTHL